MYILYLCQDNYTGIHHEIKINILCLHKVFQIYVGNNSLFNVINHHVRLSIDIIVQIYDYHTTRKCICTKQLKLFMNKNLIKSGISVFSCYSLHISNLTICSEHQSC